MAAEMVGLGATDTAQRTSKKILCMYIQKKIDSLVKNSGRHDIYL